MKLNKKHLHHVWRKLRPISYWYFLAAFIIFGVIAVYELRKNNFTMIKLRDDVVAADKANGDVETPLRKLREFVYAHMNTNLSSGEFAIKPPIQLKYRYERLVEAERQKTGTDNEKIYTEAQADCERRFPKGLSGSGRVKCVQEYVDSHGVKEQAIPDSLYKFDFVSPAWSPDLAGWSLVISGLFLILFLFRFGLEKWFKHELKEHS